MNSKRPGIVKSTARAATGGVIVVAALLALMFFRGAGSGTGDADSPNVAPALVTTDPPSMAAEDPSEAETDVDGLTPNEQKALSSHVLSILIDEHDYLIGIPDGATMVYHPCDIERLVELAGHADGDSNGIRVRIVQRESARPSAEENLKLALASAGVDVDALYQQSKFVP